MKNLWLKISAAILLFPSYVFAQASGTGIQKAFPMVQEVAGNKPYNYDKNLTMVIADVLQLALSILGILFVIFMIYGGYIWLTAAGNEQKADKAKSIITESILGLVIVIGAYAISYFVIYAFNSQIKL